VIQSFACKDTASVFSGGKCPARFQSFRPTLERKLAMLNAAHTLLDLKSPPGNNLEKLKGDRAGRYSIWVNGPYRLVFRWSAKGPSEVVCENYHR
jgi:proteic killer suppression protein